jgi:transposase-like protein
MAENDVRTELMALLRYANYSAIARELGVSAQAVKNWAEGRNTSPARLVQVRALYGLDTTKEAAPSLVTRRLLTGVIALESKAGVSPDELATAQASAAALESALEVDARLAAELERSRRRSDERAGGPTAAPGGGSLGSKRQSPK